MFETLTFWQETTWDFNSFLFKSGEEKLKFFPLLSSSNIYWTKRALKSSRIFMEQDMGGKYYFCSVFCLDYSFVYVENSQGITFSL